jgi:hypothetical protein
MIAVPRAKNACITYESSYNFFLVTFFRKVYGMGGACRTYGIDNKCIHAFIWNPEGKKEFERVGVDRSILLK